jgi:hypothetical protein
MSMRLASIVITGLVVLFSAQPARAAIITYHFEGTVDSSFGFGIPVGTPFEGTFSYDPNVVDGNANAAIGAYTQAGSFDFSVGPLVDSTSLSLVLVLNDVAGGDRLYFGQGGPLFLGLVASIVLFDSQQLVLGSDALPAIVPALGEFDEARFDLALFTGSDDPEAQLGGRLTSLERVPLLVPEPTSLSLLGLGLIALRALRPTRGH